MSLKFSMISASLQPHTKSKARLLIEHSCKLYYKLGDKLSTHNWPISYEKTFPTKKTSLIKLYVLIKLYEVVTCCMPGLISSLSYFFVANVESL